MLKVVVPVLFQVTFPVFLPALTWSFPEPPVALGFVHFWTTPVLTGCVVLLLRYPHVTRAVAAPAGVALINPDSDVGMATARTARARAACLERMPDMDSPCCMA